jgi:sugar lactone lactonase YvrE
VTATATTLLERADGLVVEAVMYPHPDYQGRPWSQWGQGVTLTDGRHFSAIGDHQPRDGNSYIYQYDPAGRTLTQIADVLSLVDHQPGAWGYGKVHAQMNVSPCGTIYFSSYWGSRRGIDFSDGYRGDILFEIDPAAGTVGAHDVILENHGVPSMAIDPGTGLLYMEAIDPLVEDRNQGPFVVYDAQTDTTVFRDDRADHTGFRSIAVDAEGRALYAIEGGRLARYDPATNQSSDLDVQLPGNLLRAATVAAPDGTIYGATRQPDEFFALDPDGTVRDLGPARGYTTSMALSLDGSTFYYVPDAHGAAWQSGAPLSAVDTATGEERVVVELDDLAVAEFGIHLGGTYNVSLDPGGQRLYLGMNAGPAEDDGFGEVILVVVTLP